jgi:hypothetical protein
MIADEVEALILRVAVLEHRDADVVIRVQVVDETSRVRADGNHVRAASVQRNRCLPPRCPLPPDL